MPSLSATRRGFTIIEMLVVMVVIGILATIAFVRLQAQKDKATIAGMTSDLRATSEEQEAYYFQHQAYSPTIDSLNSNPSPGNIVVINEGTASGWSGTISNPKVAQKCYITIGSAVPVGSSQADRGIDCS